MSRAVGFRQVLLNKVSSCYQVEISGGMAENQTTAPTLIKRDNYLQGLIKRENYRYNGSGC